MGLEDKLREYLIRGSKAYNGVHYIYENQEECRKHQNDVRIWKWAIDDVRKYNIKDWLQAEDGYVVQILHIRTMVNKYGYVTYFVRVPMGTFACNIRQDDSVRFPRLYAQFSNGTKTSASIRSRFHYGIHEKIKFASLIVAGVHPFKAYSLIYRPKTFLTNYQLNSKVTELMADDVVQKEISGALAKFQNDFDNKFSYEKILEHLEELLDNSEKGTAAHRGNIQFIMELKKMIASSKGKNNAAKVQKAEEIGFEEQEDAPELGQ
jgi:hypothetical protein